MNLRINLMRSSYVLMRAVVFDNKSGRRNIHSVLFVLILTKRHNNSLQTFRSQLSVELREVMSLQDSHQMKVLLTPYFAPYKVVLLALIAAYCAGILPTKTHRPLLSVIVRYIEGPSIHDDDMRSVGVPTLEEMMQNVRGACMKADAVEGSKFAKDLEMRVLHALWTLQSLDSLHSFIMRSRSLLVDNLRAGREVIESSSAIEIPSYMLTNNSFLGRFVLNCIVSFESLEFDKVVLLWKSFVSFRASSEEQWVAKGRIKDDFFGSSSAHDDPSVIVNLLKSLKTEKLVDDIGDGPEEELILLSHEDISKLIDYQVHILETYGTPSLPQFKTILSKMAQSETGKLPSTHYIKYLECLRDADYEGAFNALHRYFDYMMSNRQTVFYQYALLSLATLHAAFNCDNEAIRAIEESISVARENKDVDCLNFLLTWLFNFLKDRPTLRHEFFVSNDQLLQFLKSKAADYEKSNSNSIHSTAYQSDAIQLMLEGDTIPNTIEALTKAMYISLNGGSLTNLTAFVSFCELNSSFWLRSGQHDLADAYTTIGLDASTSIGQKVSVMIRKATLKFISGEIEKSFEILKTQESLINNDLRLKKQLSRQESLLRARQSIRICRYHSAEVYLSKLRSREGEYDNIDIECTFHYLSAMLEFEIGNLDKSFEIIEQVKSSQFAQLSKNRYWFIKFSLLHCEMMISREDSSSIRALNQVIQCFKLAQKSGYELLVLESLLKLIDLLIFLKQYDDSLDLIKEFLPNFNKSCDLELKSKAFKSFAHILTCQFTESDEKDMTVITKIIKNLEIAIDGFKKISDFKEIKRCLQLQERIGKLIQHSDLLQHCGEMMNQLDERIEQETRFLG